MRVVMAPPIYLDAWSIAMAGCLWIALLHDITNYAQLTAVLLFRLATRYPLTPRYPLPPPPPQGYIVCLSVPVVWVLQPQLTQQTIVTGFSSIEAGSPQAIIAQFRNQRNTGTSK